MLGNKNCLVMPALMQKCHHILGRESAASGKLQDGVWDISGIRINIYNAVILPTFLSGVENRTTYQFHAKKQKKKKVNRFHMSCLRKFLNMKW